VASVVARCAAAARKRGSSLKAPLDTSSSSDSAQKSADSSRYRRAPAAASSLSTCHTGAVQAVSHERCTFPAGKSHGASAETGSHNSQLWQEKAHLRWQPKRHIDLLECLFMSTVQVGTCSSDSFLAWSRPCKV